MWKRERKRMSNETISWGELAELTHATQVERFGWCICEGTNGEGQLADDCPREEDTIQCTRCGASVEEQTLMKLGDALICEICWEDI
jgi:formylmethanofuran dehydrogenase subunit E